MTIRSQKDFFAGLMFSVVGTAFAWGASTYTIGTGARMGPGYFPLVLGVLLAVLGVVITVTSFGNAVDEKEKVGAIAWRPLVFIISANLVFGVCLGGVPAIGLPPLGLIIGIYLLTFIASNAGKEFALKGVLVLATVLSLLSYVAFVLLLKLQFPVWPAFFKG